MKESVGYTLSLNIVIIFITIVLTFLCSALIYFKSNKVSNVIVETIEKYEGYNSKSKEEILIKLSSLGYSKASINCAKTIDSYYIKNVTCNVLSLGSGQNGYCVYLCEEGDYYYYRVRTNMMINIPIINDLLNIPIVSNTNRLYNFEKKLKD